MIRQYRSEDYNQVKNILYATGGNDCPWLNTDLKIQNDLVGAERAYVYVTENGEIGGFVYKDPVQLIEGKKRVHFYIFTLLRENERKIIEELFVKINSYLDEDAYKTTIAFPKSRKVMMDVMKNFGYIEYFQSVLMEYEGELQKTSNDLKESLIQPNEYVIYKETSNESFFSLRKQYDMIPLHLYDLSEENLEDTDEIYSYKVGDEIVGFSKGNKELEEVIVRKDHWRKGYGKEIVKYSMNRILLNNEKKVRLYVIAGNKAAINLYSQLGFQEKMVVQVMEKKQS